VTYQWNISEHCAYNNLIVMGEYFVGKIFYGKGKAVPVPKLHNVKAYRRMEILFIVHRYSTSPV
jgi:hypothetical protein